MNTEPAGAPQAPEQHPGRPESPNSPSQPATAAPSAHDDPSTTEAPTAAETIEAALRGAASWGNSDRVNRLLAAHRADVLREAERKAREIVARLWGDGTTQEQSDRAGGARAVEWEIGLMASGNDEPAAVPDFFQPGHSYTHRNGSTFTCVAVTTHPDSGERVALGWHTDTAGWTFIDVRNINHWNHEYDGVQPPAEAGEVR